MKNLKIAVIALLMLNSCSKDDNQPTMDVEGVWKLKSFHGIAAYDINQDGLASSNLLNEYYGCGEDNSFTFTKDGTVMHLKQRFLKIGYCYDDVFNGTWVKDKNSLAITLSDKTVTYQLNPGDKTMSITIPSYTSYQTSSGNRMYATVVFTYKKQE